MSAIFGMFHLDNRPVEREALSRMDAALSMHGPDGGGYWCDGPIGLGHRLLRVTPEDASERQPATGAGGTLVLVANGRLHNRPELFAALNIPPAGHSQPDSALIATAYERWGDACVHHLIGTFTAALWDARRRRLVIVRSPIYSPSLFYAEVGKTLAFATMPKGLFALPGLPRAMDEQYLADALASTGTEPGATYYRQVRRLEPGQILAAEAGEWSIKAFWSPDFSKPIHLARDEEYVDAFIHLFQRVVKDHMRSRTPVGVMMSGGFDSTAVAALTAQHYEQEGQRLATFTEVPPANSDGALIRGRYADETPYVQAMARRYENLDLNLVHSSLRLYTDGLTQFFAAAEIPFQNASNRAWYEAILRAAQAQGVRVLLTGGSGNFTISWRGSSLLAQCLRAKQWGQGWEALRWLAKRRGIRSAASALITEGVYPFLPGSVYLAAEQLRKWSGRGEAWNWRTISPIHPNFAQEQAIDARSRARKDHLRHQHAVNSGPSRLRSIFSDVRRGDGIESGYADLFGVTVMDPTADVRLVEFCLSLPESQYQRQGVTRWLLRRAMADHLPGEILNNPLRGLQAAGWFELLQQNQAQLRDQLAFIAESELARRALDLPRLQRLVDNLAEPSASAGELALNYRGMLERGVMTGRFIRWVETGQ